MQKDYKQVAKVVNEEGRVGDSREREEEKESKEDEDEQ